MKIDAEDRGRVNQFKWGSQGKYLRLNRHYDGAQHNIYLHHFLIGMPLDRALYVDHINRDRSDNRKSNLRFVTAGENVRNRKVAGVYWDKDRGNWVAQCVDGKARYLGSFPTRKSARRAYLTWRRSYYGKQKTLAERLARNKEKKA